MKVLVIKLTSMGDVLHLLPALTDLQQAHSEIEVDWVVEESFTEIASWHPLVNKVIPVATRRWRRMQKGWFGQVKDFLRQLREQDYDLVIDAQGLMKSAVIASLAKGRRVGFCRNSIKETAAAWSYQQCISVDREQHAIDRLRQLFAQIFNYPLPNSPPDSALNGEKINAREAAHLAKHKPTVFLFHGTTWQSKKIPDSLWQQLAQLAEQSGYKVTLVWGNKAEKNTAQQIANTVKGAQVLDKMSLTELSVELASAEGAIAVDTGLGHLAAALGLPCVSIYGATNSTLTGTKGANQIHIQTDYDCSPCLLKQCDKLTRSENQKPCYLTLTAESIWHQLDKQMKD